MIRPISGLRAILLPLCGLLLTAGTAHAGTYTGNSSTGYDDKGVCTTIGSDNGDFNDPRNWGSPCHKGNVPGPGSAADLAGHPVHGTTINVSNLITNGGSLVADTINTSILNINRGAVSGRSGSASKLTVSSSFNWTDGTISTIGATLGPKCVTTISGAYDNAGSGSGGKYLHGGAILLNQGKIVWSGASISGGDGGGTLNNAKSFNMNSDGYVGTNSAGDGINFINSGLFAKTSGSGETFIGLGNSFMNNGGTLQAKAGIFDPSVAYGNITTLTSGSTIAPGAGAVRQSFTWHLDGTINVAGKLRLTAGGTYGLATLTGPGKIDWRSGGFGADSTVTKIVFAPDMHAAMTGPGTKEFGALTNQGTLTWDGGTVSNTLTNSGTFNLINDGDLSGLSLINTGTFAKTGGAGTVTTGFHHIDNSGTIDIQKGILQLDFNPNGGNDIFRSGSVIQGKGKILDYYRAAWDGTVALNINLQLNDNNGGDATINGPVTINGAGKINWYGGVMDSVTLGSGLTVNVLGTPGKGFSNGISNCTNLGTLNWNGGAPLGLGSNLINSGTFNVLASGVFAGGVMTNKGTLNTFGGTSRINGSLVNSNIVNLGTLAKPGTLQFYSGNNDSFQNTGTLNAFITSGTAGHYSQLQGLSDANAATHLTLGGKVVFAPASSYVADPTNQIVFVQVFQDRASYSGKFTSITGLPTVGGRAFQSFYNPLDVTLGLLFNLTGRTFRSVPLNGAVQPQGIANTTITLQPATGAAVNTTTDVNGYYKFSNLPLGSYTVSANNGTSGFDPASQKVKLPTTGTDGVSPDGSASFQTYAASAKVVDTNGAPISGITVQLTGKGLSAVTDANGLVTFLDLRPGTYTLTPTPQTGLKITPSSAGVRLPTTGVAGQSPNGQVIFTGKSTTMTTTAGASGQSG